MRTIYSPDGATRGQALSIEDGGTGATTIPRAVENLGVVRSVMVGHPAGVPALDDSGNIRDSDLPEGLAMLSQVSLLGATNIFKGRTSIYTITNYDSSATYDISFSTGTYEVDADNIIYTAPNVPGEIELTVNGIVYDIVIEEEVVDKPTILYPTNSLAVSFQNPLAVTASNFVTNVPGGVQTSSLFQIAIDESFQTIVATSNGSSNLTFWAVSGLSEGIVYHLRVRYTGEEGGVSDWSDTTTFQMTNLQRAYSVAGTYTLTIPAGIAGVQSLVVGGGGGGGAGNSEQFTTSSRTGSGGGSGGSQEKYTVVDPGDVLTVVIGSGGSRGSYYATEHHDPDWGTTYLYETSVNATNGQASTLTLNNSLLLSTGQGGNRGLNGFEGLGGGAAVSGGNPGSPGGVRSWGGGAGGASVVGAGGAGGYGWPVYNIAGGPGGPGGGGGGSNLQYNNATVYGGFGGAGFVNLILVPLTDVQPNAPELLTASIGVPGFGLTASFQTSTFSSPVEDIHVSTDWELSTSATFATTVQSYYDDTVNKTARTFTGLTSGMTYYVRGRHVGEKAIGLWSNTVTFTAISNEIEYSSHGSYSLTVPAGIESIDVPYLVAGGGSGGNGSGDNEKPGDSGGGGAGSGLKSSLAIPVVAGDIVQINVGRGGGSPRSNPSTQLSDGQDSAVLINGINVLLQLSGLRGGNSSLLGNNQGTPAAGRDGGIGATDATGGPGINIPLVGIKGAGGNGGPSAGGGMVSTAGYPGLDGYAKIKLNPILPPNTPTLTPSQWTTSSSYVQVTGSYFSSPSGDTPAAADWVVSANSDYSSPMFTWTETMNHPVLPLTRSIWQSDENQNLIINGYGVGSILYVRMRYRGVSGLVSSWGTTQLMYIDNSPGG